MKKAELVIASTGAANLASVQAMCARSDVEALITTEYSLIEKAERVLLPGVGAFGAAMGSLRTGNLDQALASRIAEGRATMGICLGMQMFCLSSEEAPGIGGIGAIQADVGRFSPGLPLPQLGWNRVTAAQGDRCIESGWAYFANSYRLSTTPQGYRCATSNYGEEFVAALEGAIDKESGIPGILLCQFHPELSGEWGQRIFLRWMGMEAPLPLPSGSAELPKKSSETMPPPASRATAIRVLPCLDIKGGRVVKGTKFQNLVDSGDPAELAGRYEEEGADEIALLDISATIEERRTALESVATVRKRLSIPLSVGGGIKNVQDAQRLLNAGADRVSVNSAAVRNPELIRELADRFGVQCVIVAIDASRNAQGGWEVFIDAGKKATGLDAVDWARRCATLGAGEILLTSIDKDGTGEGYDEALITAVSEAAGIPVIASGGAVECEHFLAGAKAGASALLGAGAFHRRELTAGRLKESLESFGVEVRR